MSPLEDFLKNIAKPLMWFLNSVVTMLFRLDKWYSAKSDLTKKDLRWGLISTVLLAMNIYGRVEANVRSDTDNFRNTVLLNSKQKSIDECEERYLHRLEKEIEKLEKYEKEIIENDRKIKNLNTTI